MACVVRPIIPITRMTEGEKSEYLNSLLQYMDMDQGYLELVPSECGPIPAAAAEITQDYWDCYANFPFKDWRYAVGIQDFLDGCGTSGTDAGTDAGCIGLDQNEIEDLCRNDFGDPYDIHDTDQKPNVAYWECMEAQIESSGYKIFFSGNFGAPAEFDFFSAFVQESGVPIPTECKLMQIDWWDVNSAYVGCVVQSILPLSTPSQSPATADNGVIDLTGLNTITFSEKIRESKAKSIAQTVSASLSLMASIAVVCMIFRSYARLSTTFHRLLLGLSIADIIASFWMILSTLPAPVETSGYMWNPRGNVHSCNTQGFFLFLGLMGASCYNSMLCMYYLAVIKYNKNEEYIRVKLEPFLHGVPIVLSLVGAISTLAMQSFNASSTYCFVAKDPPYCGREVVEGVEIVIPCRSGEASKILFSIFAAKNYIVLPIIIAATMTIMHLEVLKNKKKLSKYGVGALRANLNTNVVRNVNLEANGEQDGNNTTTSASSILSRFKSSVQFLIPSNRSTSQQSAIPGARSRSYKAKKKQSRIIVHKALAYTIAYFVTYTFPLITSVQYFAGKETSFALSMLSSIFYPLQGFFNFLVFVYPKVTSAKRSKKNPSWFQAFVTALKSRGDKRKRRSDLRSPGPKKKNRMAMMMKLRSKKRPTAERLEEEKCEVENPMLTQQITSRGTAGASYSLVPRTHESKGSSQQSKSVSFVSKGPSEKSANAPLLEAPISFTDHSNPMALHDEQDVEVGL